MGSNIGSNIIKATVKTVFPNSFSIASPIVSGINKSLRETKKFVKANNEKLKREKSLAQELFGRNFAEK